ncbi:MAG: sulfite exporter TauE/SafE family protein [Gammaproteobacteria bacterium]|nr:sulfite exporter TauE/SafE family protein [Gammaproteobacteria bacterium]
MIAFTVAGLVVGIVVGATGVGGGALMTPILILGFGISPAVAVGTDLLFAAVTKAFGTVLHRNAGNVNWPIVGLLACGSLPASLMTVMFLNEQGISPEMEVLMKQALAGAIAFTSLSVLFKAGLLRVVRNGNGSQHLDRLRVVRKRLRVPLTVLSGAFLGVLVTLSSVGAGVIGATILLLLYPRMRAIEVVGTDLAHAVPLTALAGLGHMHLGTTDLSMLAYLLLGSLPGIWLGSKVGMKLPDHVLKPIMAVILLVIGVSLLF